jgi:hypothetical protein
VKRYVHASLFAILSDDNEPVSDTFSQEVIEGEEDLAGLALADWLSALAEQIREGLADE